MDPSVNVELHDLNHATLSIELWGSIWLYRRPEGRSWPIGTSLSVLPITFPWRYCREDHTTSCIKLTNGHIPLPSRCLRSPSPSPPSPPSIFSLPSPSPPSPPFTSPSLPPSLHIHPPFPSLPPLPTFPLPPGYWGVMTSWCFCNSICGWPPMFPWVFEINMPILWWCGLLEVPHHVYGYRWWSQYLSGVSTTEWLCVAHWND